MTKKQGGARDAAAGTMVGLVHDLRSPAYLAPPVRPTRAAAIGRVFGYAGLTLFWVVALGAGLFACMLALPGMLGSPSDGGGLSSSGMFARPDAWVAVIAIPLVVMIFGYLTVFIVLASASASVTAATLFVRSLRRSYRGEQLSLTILSKGGEAVGPASTALTGVALSLLPVRLTRWTKVLIMMQFAAWLVKGLTLRIGAAWGTFYFFTVGWLSWPVDGVVRMICTAISAFLLAGMVWIIWRHRSQFADIMPKQFEGTIYANSWPRK